MTLLSGVRLGPYLVQSLLGAGGMGEVYRAVDTQLGRAVALKVLPAAFAQDPERLARLEREARALASLNHPNIASIYGIEPAESGYALVMELVEGPTLADRLSQGPLPTDEALEFGRQIAEALEAAHDQGIVHRDLKPANIKVRPDGSIKVLDFGLAKATEAAAASALSASQLPTITTPAMTAAGVILGTAAYMSPEQAKGRPVDKRTDVWAFGCVLYEMLTARRAFEGETVAETLARVLERDPDMGRLPATLPPVMRAFLARCLHRDLKQRVRDVGDVRLALMGAFGGPAADAPATRTWLVPALSALAALVIGGLVVRDRAAPDIIAQPPARTALLTADVPPVNVSGFGPDVVLTPDGTRVVYSSRGQLFVRALSELAPRLLVSGSIPGNLFVSPDGRWIGFTERTQLRRISIDGGPASTICVIDGTGTRGSTWTADGTIVFATSFDETGLQRVAAEGGTPSVLTRPDRSRGEDDHLWPEMLPDGRNLLFTITAVTGGLEAAQVATFDLETGARKVLFKGGTHARYVPSGHLVYMAGGSLYAVAFDLATLEVHGDGIPVIGGVVTTNNGGGNFSTSINGALLYVAASTVAERQLLWVDRAGREEDVGTPMRPYFSPRVSPDGSRIAVRIADRDQDIWVWEVQRQVLRRFTLGTSLENSPAWAPDGARLLFTSNTGGAGMNMWSGASDGSRSAERLFDSASTKSFTAISPDGRFGLFHEVSPTRARDLMLLPLAPVSEPRPLVQSTSEERNGILSPDGRWLAYESDESGRFEVYVRPFPNVGDGQWRVSTDGGVQPLWSPDGRSLFFLDGQQRLSDVRVDANGRAWSASQPETVFDRAYFPGGQDWLRSYDISPDGKRFVMIKDEERARPAPILVQHWTEELKRLVPVTR